MCTSSGKYRYMVVSHLPLLVHMCTSSGKSRYYPIYRYLCTCAQVALNIDTIPYIYRYLCTCAQVAVKLHTIPFTATCAHVHK